MQWTTAGGQNPGDAEAKGKRYATYQSRIWCIWCARACDNKQQYEVHAQAVPPHPSTWHARKTTHATQTQDMMEQEHQEDNAREELATPSTPTTTTTREGRQRPADLDDLSSPRSREHAPGALRRSPTNTVYSAHQEPTTQCGTGHYPGTANTTGPRGGETTGEGTTRRQLEPEPDQTPSQRTDYSASATDRTASNTTR